MSSSKGRIIVGNTGFVIDEVEFAKRQKELDLWDEETEKKFLNKIKEKASLEAQKIIKNGYEKAKSIKQQAQRQGYNEGYKKGYEEGLKKAQQEADDLKSQLKEKFSVLINSIEEKKEHIIKSLIDDILELIFVSVEKITGFSYIKHRRKILAELVNSCLKEIKEARDVKIYVSKEDYPLLEELLKHVKEKYIDIKNWHIVKKDNLGPAEVIVDTGLVKVTDSFNKRYEMVKKILEDVEIND